MTLQKLRRWLGFPLEDRYRVHTEQDIVQSSLRPGIFSALLILAFQAVMMVLSLLRKGGPFASLRRQGYWWLYVTLFSVTLLFLLLIVFLMRRRRPCLDTFFFTAADILHRFFVSVGDVRHAFGPIRRQQPERFYLRHAFCRSPHRAAALAVRAYLYRELPVFKPAVALYACRTG